MPQPNPSQPLHIPLSEGMVRVEPVEATPNNALELLLNLEADARKAATLKEFMFFATNETRKILGFRQAFYVQLRGDKLCEIMSVSSLATVERHAPLIVSLEAGLKQLRAEQKLAQTVIVSVASLNAQNTTDLNQYPFPNLMWLPFVTREAHAFAGLLVARETPWEPRDYNIATRLAATYSHAACALTSRSRLFLETSNRKPWAIGAGIIALMALFIPIPMSTLAPVEVVAREPIVVAAPIEGVVEGIKIEPNTPVKKGDILLSFQNIALKNKFDIAERAVQVARAKEMKAAQSAFTDATGRHDLAITNAELKLAEAERDYAKDMLAKTTLIAPKDGLAIFSSVKEWEGRPVMQGERIIEIADPALVELGIELPVKDAIVLHDGADVKVFLDSDPLHALPATLTRAGYHAQPTAGNGLSFMLYARLNDRNNFPRIGYRGTAQVYGGRTFLGFYLFRRPISALRQMIGL